MNDVYFQLAALGVQVALIALLFRSKKRIASLPEPARGDRTYGINAAIIAWAIAFLISSVLLASAIARLTHLPSTP